MKLYIRLQVLLQNLLVLNYSEIKNKIQENILLFFERLLNYLESESFLYSKNMGKKKLYRMADKDELLVTKQLENTFFNLIIFYSFQKLFILGTIACKL